MGSVLHQISQAMDLLARVFSSSESLRQGLSEFMRHLISAGIQSLDWAVSPDEEPSGTKYRALIILMAGMAGHEE